MSFGGFSWKRALGITSAKRKIAKATGIPTTKARRKRKAFFGNHCLDQRKKAQEKIAVHNVRQDCGHSWYK